MSSMLEETKLIGLDWDNIAYSIAKERVDFILKYDFIDYIDLFESPNGEGYHARIYTKYPIPYEQRLRYRQQWKDDGRRIVTDLLKADSSPKEVLFNCKIYNGQEHKEIFMEKFKKNAPGFNIGEING